MKLRRPRPDEEIPDGEIIEEVGAPPRSEEEIPSSEEVRRARRLAVTRSSVQLEVEGERPLYGSRAFFRRAAEQLVASTRHGLELAGAAYGKELPGGRTVLVGLRRRGSGLPGRVAISPEWGAVLWHTHPGLRGSLAAFSDQDLEAARLAKRPLLVIGYGGLSPDVVTTLTLPLGVKGLLLSSGFKGLLALEKSGRLKARLLRLGVAARVCYPSGRIEPVLRAKAPPSIHAYEEVSYAIDRSVGVVERAGQRVIRAVLAKASGA